MKTFKQFLNENVGIIKAAKTLAGVAGLGAATRGLESFGSKYGLTDTLAKGFERLVPQDVLAKGPSPAEEERRESEDMDPTFGKPVAIANFLNPMQIVPEPLNSMMGINMQVPTMQDRDRKEAAQKEQENDKKYLEGLSSDERNAELRRRQDMTVTRTQNAAKVAETMKRLDQQRGIFTEENRRGPGSGSRVKEIVGNTIFRGGEKSKKIEPEDEELSVVDTEPSEAEKASIQGTQLNRRNTKDTNTRTT